MSIPRIIHQTWKSDDIPERWQPFCESWRQHHPGWQWRLWTDVDNLAFVTEHYPQLLEKFEAYPYAIQRADAIRYMILHHHGGLYVDMDFECLRPVDALLEGAEFVAGVEPALHPDSVGANRLICNAFMAAVPGCRALAHVLETLAKKDAFAVEHRDVLKLTGPVMLTEAIDSHPQDGVKLLATHLVYPWETDPEQQDALRRGGVEADAMRRRYLAQGSYAIHHFDSSWIRNLAGDLHNPTPHEVPGFHFFPGLDSCGFDVANYGRDIPAVAARCLDDPAICGFNTDGFVKSAVLPPGEWTPMERATAREGLYLKVDRSRG